MKPLRLVLGADTLCWHMRLERGDVTLEQVCGEAAEAGAEALQLSLHHARDRASSELPALAERAGSLGLKMLASGDFLGGARHGDTPDVAVERVKGWIEGATAIGSPILRVCSGFYRADLAGIPGAIEAERRYMVDALAACVPLAADADLVLAIENHSDFTLAEYHSILDEVGDPRVRVFLDLINPVAALENPDSVVRSLAPLAVAGHVKDFDLTSIPIEDGYHRRGFAVMWRYPGEGVADLESILSALSEGLDGRELTLSVEGLDNHVGVPDQLPRLKRSIEIVREIAERVGV